MKKTNKIILLSTLLLVGWGQVVPVANAASIIDNPGLSLDSEEVFITKSTECLSLIEQAAERLGIVGVATISYVPGDTTKAWISRMQVMGKLANEKVNLVGIAYSKAAEAAVTLKDSGNQARKGIVGEFGYQGAVIAHIDGGYLIASFSGATGQQDYDVAKEGLDWLVEQFE